MPKKKIAILTQTEVRIIALICKQYTNEEIGNALKLRKRTIESYRNDFKKKIKAKNTAGIVIYAIKNGIYKI